MSNLSTPPLLAGNETAILERLRALDESSTELTDLLDAYRLRVEDRLNDTAPSARRPPAPEEIARHIDHTVLDAAATEEDIRRACADARRHGFAAVCVNSGRVSLAARCLRGSLVKTIAVVGFPLGAPPSGVKAFEARVAVADGAREIDMVMNIGALKSRDFGSVLGDIRQVVRSAAPYPVKVILETAELDRAEIIVACALSRTAGAAFVKTSTGFGPGGAKAEDVALMRAAVGPETGVKASGGIRSYEDAAAMMAAGADRIGSSAGEAICRGERAESGSY